MKKTILLRFLFVLTCFFFSVCGCPGYSFAEHREGPSISFTFDDGFVGSYTYAAPVLARYGFSATMYVVTSVVGRSGYLGYLTWDDVRKMQSEGWEIGSHSHTHAHLPDLSPNMIDQELRISAETLREHEIDAVSLAVPFGEYNETVLDIARRYYKSSRLAWDDWHDYPITGRQGRNVIPLVDPFRVSAVTVRSTMTVEEVVQMIDEAIEKKRWLVLLFHDLVSEKDIENEGGLGQYDYSAEKFERIVGHIAALKEKGVLSVLPVRDAVRVYRR
ncbi:MAG: polysaccharide deacetylase family protein [Candidatus Yonathbacteria bacterium]|nr:polysaccharide deacetylase family protein [Candidatus Yonathbacteria bacterium]